MWARYFYIAACNYRMCFLMKLKETFVAQAPVHVLSCCCVAVRSSFGALLGCAAVGLFTIFSFSSCGDQSDNITGQTTPLDTGFFYPARQFFESQIGDVENGDSILYISSENDLTSDSAFIDKKRFAQLAGQFIESDISAPEIRIYYRQSAFLDETTGSIIFSYIAANKSLPIRSLDVLIDTLKQEVKRIFISRTDIGENDTLDTKLGWKTDNSFFIYRIEKTLDGKEKISRINVQWKKNK